MSTPTPDTPPSPKPGYNPFRRNPDAITIPGGQIMAALLLIIPGLCFGLAVPMRLEAVQVLLLVVWIVTFLVALASVIVAIGKRIIRAIRG